MSGAAFGLVFVLFIAAFVAIFYFAWQQAKKRREAMAAYAASRGWRYVEEDRSLVDRFDGAPFGVGHGRRAYNVVLGTYDERPVVAFDYVYKTTSGSGENRKTETHHYSVVALNIGVVMPTLRVTPQNIVSGFFGRVTNSDIELESEDFNRAFVVNADHRKFASDVLHPRMMELVSQWPDMAWRFERDSALTVRSGQLEPPGIDERLRRLDAILDAIPDFVWREVRGQ